MARPVVTNIQFWANGLRRLRSCTFPDGASQTSGLLTGMRIRSKVGLVGGIPIAIGAAIAVVAWFLLAEAERARSGAVLAGAVYRDLLSVMRARDDYVGATPAARERFAIAFSMVSDGARAQLGRLAGFAH